MKKMLEEALSFVMRQKMNCGFMVMSTASNDAEVLIAFNKDIDIIKATTIPCSKQKADAFSLLLEINNSLIILSNKVEAGITIYKEPIGGYHSLVEFRNNIIAVKLYFI